MILFEGLTNFPLLQTEVPKFGGSRGGRPKFLYPTPPVGVFDTFPMCVLVSEKKVLLTG